MGCYPHWEARCNQEHTLMADDGTGAQQLDRELLIWMLRKMMEIREFELAVSDVYKRGLMPGLAHLYVGEEAVAVGACAVLRPTDRITSTHRGHGHCIAKGGDLKLMMAELMGRAPGYCGGKGGSMHIADLDLGILGANGVVGGGFGLATGSGLSARLLGRDDVTLCFFGDGASNQGILHESINLASIWKLSVVYICENNLYGISMSQTRSTNVRDIAQRAQAYGIPSMIVDGNDVAAVYRAIGDAVAHARAGKGPVLVECKTYRWFGHHVGDPGSEYRTAAEVEEWKQRCPIRRYRGWLLEQGIMDQAAIDALTADVQRAVQDAVAFAESAPFPERSEATTHVYA
jgi:acetoin:2,6-dichlorophenolindophenol oxidoreductase subunit alpha